MQTFSRLYLIAFKPQADSERARVQLLAAFRLAHEKVSSLATDLFGMLRLKRGTSVKHSGYGGYDWEVFFRSSPLDDLLDSVTSINDILFSSGYRKIAEEFRGNVQNAFDTQNLQYEVIETGLVQLRVDQEFERDRSSTMMSLETPRYRGAKAAFVAAHQALSATSLDGKTAIREAFEACEIVFKLMFPKALRLGGPELGTHLTPVVSRHYGADLPAQTATDRLLKSFSDWVSACHQYRHGQGQEEPNQPPLEVAVLILSAGAAHLRWLIHLDQATLPAAP